MRPAGSPVAGRAGGGAGWAARSAVPPAPATGRGTGGRRGRRRCARGRRGVGPVEQFLDGGRDPRGVVHFADPGATAGFSSNVSVARPIMLAVVSCPANSRVMPFTVTSCGPSSPVAADLAELAACACTALFDELVATAPPSGRGSAAAFIAGAVLGTVIDWLRRHARTEGNGDLAPHAGRHLRRRFPVKRGQAMAGSVSS